jgi:methylmalonyl-CoA mutase N-terminal domain/subunit
MFSGLDDRAGTESSYSAAERTWRRRADAIEEARPAHLWMRETDGGIPVASSYGPHAPGVPQDDEEYLERLGFPGAAPFTRGGYPTGNRHVSWQTQQVVGFGTAEETRERLQYIMRQGQSGHRNAVMNIVFDQPTLNGMDSDHRVARGGVGKGGVAIDSLGDMATMIAPFDPADSFISLVVTGMGPIMLALYAQACIDRGVPLTEISGVMLNDPLTAYYGAGTYILPPRPSLRLVGDLVEFCTNHAPKWNTNGISGYHAREGGATAAMELGFTIACGLAYVQECVNRGLDPNAFAARFSFFLEVNNDFFEEVAKLRAFRRMWATELQRRFGVTDPRALLMRCHIQTAGSACTAQEPENNIVRIGIQALAAVFGGANSIHTNSMDEALSIPTESSARIALRTQQIISRETGAGRVADPLGGSYYVEHLTDAVEHEGRRYLAEIEQHGDNIVDAVINALESGYFHRQIRERAWATQLLLESGERPVVGVNCFADQAAEIDIELFQSDPALERKQLERLRAWREHRDDEAVATALSRIEAATSTSENMMPLLMTAAKDGATVGEIVTTLRTKWGIYEEPQSLALA